MRREKRCGCFYMTGNFDFGNQSIVSQGSWLAMGAPLTVPALEGGVGGNEMKGIASLRAWAKNLYYINVH
jgi:hypothetical protein